MSSAASAVLVMSMTPGDALQTTVTGAAIIPGEVIPLTGSMTYSVDLAMMPGGLQGLEITVAKVDALGAPVSAPVRVNFTGGFLMIPPGGGFTLAAPLLASGGITSLALVSTANALARVSALA